MKGFALAALTVAVLASIAWAQDAPRSGADLKTAVRLTAAKPLSVFGKVSSDGRTLVTDLNTEWPISNTGALNGHEGALVTVKCYVDVDHNTIHILAVRPAEEKYATRLGDSAFRR